MTVWLASWHFCTHHAQGFLRTDLRGRDAARDRLRRARVQPVADQRDLFQRRWQRPVHRADHGLQRAAVRHRPGDDQLAGRHHLHVERHDRSPR